MFPQKLLNILIGESNTVVSAYTMYRHLQQYCSHPSILGVIFVWNECQTVQEAPFFTVNYSVFLITGT